MVEELFTDSLGEYLSLKDTLTWAENPPPAPIQQHQSPPPAVASPQDSTTLPKVPLPTFDGDQLQWESFNFSG